MQQHVLLTLVSRTRQEVSDITVNRKASGGSKLGVRAWWPVFLVVAVTLLELILIESGPHFLPWGLSKAEASFLIRKAQTDKKAFSLTASSRGERLLEVQHSRPKYQGRAGVSSQTNAEVFISEQPFLS